MVRTFQDIDPQLFEEICLELEIGKSLASICKIRHISYSTVTGNISRHQEYAERYARAREIQADYLADETRAVLEESPVLKSDQFGNMSIDPAWVQLQKNKVDLLKWQASKLKPKVYGDSTTVKGDKDNPLFNFADALQGAAKALEKHRHIKAIEDHGITIDGDSVVNSDTPL